MLGSEDNAGPSPEAPDWWPTCPISDYLAGRLGVLAHQHGNEPLATYSGQSQPQLGLTQETPRASCAPVDDPTRQRPARRTYLCPREGCRVACQSRRDLRRHETTVHDKVYVQCQRCQKPLKGRDDNLKRHQRRYCRGVE